MRNLLFFTRSPRLKSWVAGVIQPLTILEELVEML